MDGAFMWAVFSAVAVFLLFLDLVVFSKDNGHSMRRSVTNVALFIGAAILFGLFVTYGKGTEAGASYYASYIIELAMSVDNLFVFIIIFSAFAIPSEKQHKVLLWGILGAIIFRAVFIVVGAKLLETFDFIMVFFGVILIITAVRTGMPEKEGKDQTQSIAFKLSRKIPATADMSSGKFLIRENGKLLATPLLLCLVVIELSDIIFALDSVPAALSITTDIFIVFSSNILAVMGLRSLYFVLNDVVGKLRFLKYGLAVILAFIGIKMLLAALEITHIGVVTSLSVIASVLLVSMVASVIADRYVGVKEQF